MDFLPILFSLFLGINTLFCFRYFYKIEIILQNLQNQDQKCFFPLYYYFALILLEFFERPMSYRGKGRRHCIEGCLGDGQGPGTQFTLLFLRSLAYLMSFGISATNMSCIFGLNRTLHADLTTDPTKYTETWYIWRTVN